MKQAGPLKLHLACGEVYLKDYINIDIVGDLASKNPKLAAQKTTDIGHYYKKPFKKQIYGINKKGRNIVDLRAKVSDLRMYKNGSVDEILSVNFIDHISLQDLSCTITEWRRVLKPDGRLIIDVGDARLNAEVLLNAKTRQELEWALRLVYCHARDNYDSHRWGYTPEYLEELMAEWGFKQIWTKNDFIKHAYPNFQSCFKKK